MTDYGFSAPLTGWRQVQSTCLAAVRYDPDGSLAVRFLRPDSQGRTVYRYLGVPERVFRDMLASSSKGRFHAFMLKGRYRGHWEG